MPTPEDIAQIISRTRMVSNTNVPTPVPSVFNIPDDSINAVVEEHSPDLPPNSIIPPDIPDLEIPELPVVNVPPLPSIPGVATPNLSRLTSNVPGADGARLDKVQQSQAQLASVMQTHVGSYVSQIISPLQQEIAAIAAAIPLGAGIPAVTPGASSLASKLIYAQAAITILANLAGIDGAELESAQTNISGSPTAKEKAKQQLASSSLEAERRVQEILHKLGLN